MYLHIFIHIYVLVDGRSPKSMGAVFSSLPKQHTLTVRIDAPEQWNVQATRAIQVI